MAERFNLTAQLQLQAPTNTGAVITQIRRQLKGLTVDVKVKSNVAALSKTSKELQSIDKSAQSSSKSMGQLNRTLSDAARRFSVITVATGTMLSLARAFKNSVGEAIAFERELVRISQVTGKTVKNLQGLTKEVTRLSTSLGASSKDLLNVSRVLAQAGFGAEKTRKALEILAQTSLGATFNSIQDTTEGAIAVLRQFRKEARAAGGEIKFLEQTLDAINAVSKKFAVESGDLITVIRRVGGVFEAAGGNVNELIALFTSVRATTRESAETISTGLRTIFTRLQRTDTIDQLKNLGIVLRDSQGQFVGAYEAVRRLSQGLSALDPRDFRFSAIVEQLGGFRQIGKVIPLIRQFTTAQDALNVAQGASGSVARDAATAQQSLAVQVQRVREDFDALIRKFADSSTFRSVAGGALEIAKAFIRVAEAIEPILPLVTSLIALKIGRSLAPGLASIAGFGGGARGRATGGRIHKFARGGSVPGTGNRDTVPAMLQPGEFVIRKSSAAKLGSSTLEAMNNNRFNKGKKVSRQKFLAGEGSATLAGADAGVAKGAIIRALGDKDGSSDLDIAGAFLQPVGVRKHIRSTLPGKTLLKDVSQKMGLGATGGKDVGKLINKYGGKYDIPVDIHGGSVSEKSRNVFQKQLKKKAGEAAKEFVKSLPGLQYNQNRFNQGYGKANVEQVEGNLFEAAVNSANNTKFTEARDAANATFDYPKGLSEKLSKVLGVPHGIAADAKRSYTPAALDSLVKKAFTHLSREAAKNAAIQNALLGGVRGGGIKGHDSAEQKRLRGMAMGGKIDSVPALLTPGEFVVKKSSAQSIGYGNLNKMNQTGVQRFNTGGAVQRFAGGGKALGFGEHTVSGFNAKDAAIVSRVNKEYTDETRQLVKEMKARGKSSKEVKAALVSFSRQVTKGVDVQKALSDAQTRATAATKSGRALPAGPAGVIPLAATVGGSSEPRGKAGRKRRGAGGASEGGSRSAAPAISSFSKNVRRASEVFKIAGMQGEQLKSELANYKNALRSGQDPVKSLNSILVQTRKEAEATNKARKTFRERLQNAGNNLLGPKGQRGAQMAAGAQRGGEIAGQAQQFAFMASMIGSTAIQMSSLSNATKQAASETLGMATAMIGIVGTLAQMVTGIIANIAATKASTVAHGAEAGAVGKASLGKLGGAFAGAVAGAAAVAAGFYYYSAKARAQADELAASTDEAIKKIKEGGGGSAEDIKSNVREEVALRGKSGALKGAAVTAGVSGVAVGTAAGAAAASFAAAGATAGSVVPVFGTLVGAGVGLAAGFIYYKYAAEEAAAAAEKEADALDKSVDRLVSLYQSAHQLDQALKDIDLEKDLTPEQRVKRRVSALRGSDDPSQIASGALKALSQMATEAGVSIAQLDENTFADLPDAAKRLAMNQQALADATENVTKRLNAARATLVEARGNITGDEGSAQQAMESGSDLGNALKDVLQGIDAETRTSAEASRAQADSLRAKAKDARAVADTRVAGRSMSMGTGHGGQSTQTQAHPLRQQKLKEEEKALKEAERLEAEATAAEERGRKQKESEIKVTDDSINTRRREKEQLDASIKAQEALRQATLRTEETMNLLVDQRRGLKQMEQALHNTVAAASGTAMSFDRMAPEGLGDLNRVGDQAKFADDVDAITAGESDEVKRMGQVAKDTARLLAEAKTKRVGGFAIEEKVGVEGATKELRKMVPGLEGVVGEDIFKGMAAELSRAAEDGTVSEEEWDKVFAPMIAKGKESAEGLQQVVDINNKMISFYQKQATALHKVFNDEIAVRQKLTDTQLKGAELRAQARGGSVGGGMKEASRQMRAQQGLFQRDDSRFAGRERVATAGDVGSVSKARDAAQKRLKQIAREIQTGKLKGKEATKAGIEQAKLNDRVKKTTAELARLADQSDRAADIMGEIDKERAKREQTTSVITDFVVGGADKRRGMAGAAAGVGAAVSTGTLQNQTEEQRSATVGMLDQLSDVIIAGTGGLTGKQVKQELVFQDAVKMGLDPAVAKQLALGTSKEEQLINALDRLTHQMEQAAMAQVAGGHAQGGVVYASRGASIFKPRGTDTVPAMLTPGEFVVRKSAVDQIGANNLEALNRSKGGVVYRQGGGGIGSGNAQFVGQSKKVSIMGGDAYRGLFSDSLKTIGIKKFGALLEKYYPTEKAGETLVMEEGLGGASALGVKSTRGTLTGWDEKRKKEADRGDYRTKTVGKGKEKRQLTFAKEKGVEERSVRKSMVRLLKAGKISLSNISIGEGIASSLDALVGSTDLIEKADAGSFSLRVPQFKKGPDGKSVEKEAIMAYRDRISSLRDVMQQGLPGGGGDKRKIGLADDITMSAGNPSVGGKLITVANTLAAMEKTVQQAIDGGPAGLMDIEAKLQKQKTAIKPSKKSETLKSDMLKKAAALLESQGLLMAQGGSVPGTDTVPAMLTPGEFVMNKSAVQTHGVGFMKNLNRGRVPGFRRGGLVGTGNVQYKQDGGSVANNGGGVISLDPSKVQGVLDNFNAQFSASLDNVVGVFSGFGDSLQQLVASFNGITMTHNVQVEGLISLGGLNVEAIKEELSTAIGTMVADQVSQTMDRQAKEFKSSG